MTACPREHALVAAVRGRIGRNLSSGEQRHVVECSTCREAMAITAAFAGDLRDEAGPTVTAEVVWFKAQLKARAEREELTSRPVFVVHALAGAAVAGAIAAVAGVLGGFDVAAHATRGVVLAFAVWLLIAPVAVYLAVTEE